MRFLLTNPRCAEVRFSPIADIRKPEKRVIVSVCITTLFGNAKNMLLANEAMWRGSVDEASVHVREVIARAIALGATAIIIVHNHPSGDPSPSQQDIRLTRDLVEAGKHMRIAVHDHVIVGTQGRSSMKAMGLI